MTILFSSYLRKILIRILTSLIKIYSFPSYYKLIYTTKNIHRIKKAQNKIKHKIYKNYNPDLYKLFDTKINTYNDFESYIINYTQDLASYKILHYEKTSGSSNHPKSIPYTQELLDSFNQYFKIICYDLFKNLKIKLQTGVIFISISPCEDSNNTSTNNKNTINTDADYLSNNFINNFIKSLIILPPKQLLSNSIDDFRLGLANLLIKNDKLEVISIWSPNYFLSIIDYIKNNNNINIDKQKKLHIADNNFSALWPHLKLISCWHFGASNIYINKLKQIFPNVKFHIKGILATEAPISIVIKNKYNLPFITGTYFEFLDLENNKIYPIDKLELNKSYKIIISQQSGLLRYDLGDIVQVDRFYNQCPCFKFIGRVNNTCDLVGEKLTVEQCNNLYHHFFKPNKLDKIINILIVPYLDIQSYYIIYIDKLYQSDMVNISSIDNNQLDQYLCQNIHYNNARIYDQLKTIKIIYIDNLLDKLYSFYHKNNLKIGDMKDSILVTNIHLASKIYNYLK